MSSIVPSLLRPKTLAWGHHFEQARKSPHVLIRDITLLLFSFGLMAALYFGTVDVLTRLSSATRVAYIPPFLPLSLVFLLLFLMLFVSSAASALGALYLSHDLELILASPVRLSRIFWAKYVEVFVSSSWMVTVFGLPVIIGFGVAYSAPISFFPIAILAAFPFFLIPTGGSILLAILIARFIPANRSREILFCLLAAVLLGIYAYGKSLFAAANGVSSSDDLFYLVGMLSAPNQSWLPGYWAATAISELLIPTSRGALAYISLLYSVAIALASGSFLAMKYLHSSGYSRARSGGGMRIPSRSSQKILIAMFPMVPPQYRAMFGKEIKLFSRDMAQAIQLLVLLGLCTVYLYNFRILNSLESIPETVSAWWRAILVLVNLAMGAFVVTAVGTRFVFPSVSLEGQAFWILQSSPLSRAKLLHAKFVVWYFLLATVGSAVFTAGAFAVNAEPELIVLTVLTCWIISYGIVGMAIGLGGMFANFTWEHSSQLAASFGSLVYMLSSTLFVGINMVPLGLVLGARTMSEISPKFSQSVWQGGAVCALLLLIIVNFVTTKWALSIGAQSLASKER